MQIFAPATNKTKMYNPQRITKIRENIQTSTLLTVQEKSDWLNLVDLMNDKQLTELEEILGAGSVATAGVDTQDKLASNPAHTTQPQKSVTEQQTTPVNNATSKVLGDFPPQPHLPPLSHIANIPSEISEPFRSPSSFQNSTPKPQELNTPEQSQESKTSTPKPFNLPQTKPPSRSPAEQEQVKPITPSTASQKLKPPFVLQDIEKLAELSVDTVRKFDLQSIVNTVRDVILERGYFHALELIETSPLYRTYIESGKQRLGPGNTSSAGETLLTQAEFEFVTDLLRHMRFNRL